MRSPEEIESFTLANDPVEFKNVDENGAVVLTEVFPRGPVAFFACHSRQLCLNSELCRIAWWIHFVFKVDRMVRETLF